MNYRKQLCTVSVQAGISSWQTLTWGGPPFNNFGSYITRTNHRGILDTEFGHGGANTYGWNTCIASPASGIVDETKKLVYVLGACDGFAVWAHKLETGDLGSEAQISRQPTPHHYIRIGNSSVAFDEKIRRVDFDVYDLRGRHISSRQVDFSDADHQNAIRLFTKVTTRCRIVRIRVENTKGTISCRTVRLTNVKQ